MSIQEYIGILAGLLELATFFFYIKSTLSGQTKPNRVTWWILGLVTALLTASYYASGARETIWLPIAYAVGFFVIGILSIPYGEGPVTLSTLDRVCLAGALLSAGVWWFSSSPIIALYMYIVVDFAGIVPTAYKAYLRPWTEDKNAWVIAAVASAINLFAIGEWSLAIAAYPVYLVVMNTLIAAFIFFPRKTKTP